MALGTEQHSPRYDLWRIVQDGMYRASQKPDSGPEYISLLATIGATYANTD